MTKPDALLASFEEFVHARRAALLRTAFLLVGTAEDAEDLVQIALERAIPKWGRLADNPEPYVRRILARESVNRWRRRRWREVSTDVLPDTATVERDHAGEQALRAALATLPPRQRATVVLRFYDDLTEKETAAMLGVSVSTVKSQTRDALARLRTTVAHPTSETTLTTG